MTSTLISTLKLQYFLQENEKNAGALGVPVFANVSYFTHFRLTLESEFEKVDLHKLAAEQVYQIHIHSL